MATIVILSAGAADDVLECPTGFNDRAADQGCANRTTDSVMLCAEREAL
ncbi:hypothetical protein [Nocardia fluminea]